MVKITVPPVVTISSPTTVTSVADITSTDSATQFASNSAKQVVIKNIGSNDVRIGDSSITSTRGVELKQDDFAVFDISNSDKLYHITETGTSTLTVIVLN